LDALVLWLAREAGGSIAPAADLSLLLFVHGVSARLAPIRRRIETLYYFVGEFAVQFLGVRVMQGWEVFDA
jgi:hypothetical protein